MDVVINIIVQAFNILLFLFVFKYFFADSIAKSIEDRKRLLDKIKNAESEYEKILKDAEKKSSEIIQEALNHKKKIIEEAKTLAYEEKEKIINEAKKQADEIIETAKAYWEKLKQELMLEWEKALKETSKAVVLKLFEWNIDFKEKYLEEVLKQFKS